MPVKWIRGAAGEVYIGLIGNGQRIHLQKCRDGWVVQFGFVELQRHPATLLSAQMEAVMLARGILTECLVNLSEPNYAEFGEDDNEFPGI